MMDVKSLETIKYIGGKWIIEDPAFQYLKEVEMDRYLVQKGEDMRVDLVMQSIYGDYNLKDVDVLLFINNIDNPINIREGMVLLYPNSYYNVKA